MLVFLNQNVGAQSQLTRFRGCFSQKRFPFSHSSIFMHSLMMKEIFPHNNVMRCLSFFPACTATSVYYAPHLIQSSAHEHASKLSSLRIIKIFWFLVENLTFLLPGILFKMVAKVGISYVDVYNAYFPFTHFSNINKHWICGLITSIYLSLWSAYFIIF